MAVFRDKLGFLTYTCTEMMEKTCEIFPIKNQFFTIYRLKEMEDIQHIWEALI